MCWPARETMWEEQLRRTPRPSTPSVANAIAAFEPVTMVADPRQAAEARAAVRGDVEVVELPIDDSWMRDTGPIFVHRRRRPARRRATSASTPGARSSRPTTTTRRSAARVLEHLGEERIDATDFVLEGGSIAVDGEGTLITTEQCLLHPNRNPERSTRARSRRGCAPTLGVEHVVWLGHGLVEDDDTDGHVDNICAFDRARPRAAADRRRRGRPRTATHCRENAAAAARRPASRSSSCRAALRSTTTGRRPWSRT